MNKRFVPILAAILILFIMTFPAQAGQFTLLVEGMFPDGRMTDAHVFDGFGCTGGNVSPALSWSGVPEGTSSFGLTLFDLDAPTGSGWWHWLVFNLPAGSAGLPENAGAGDGSHLPANVVQSMTDFGKPGYGGPCPPKGDKPHHYVFTLYALKIDRLQLDPGSAPALVSDTLKANALAETKIIATYGR